MRKDELRPISTEIRSAVEFARHTFTGKLLYNWYTVTQPVMECVHNYNILHITDINLYFVIYDYSDHIKGSRRRCPIAATYNLELARNILALAATQSQLELLGYVPERQVVDTLKLVRTLAVWKDLTDHNKVPPSDDELADYERAAIAVVRKALRQLNL